MTATDEPETDNYRHTITQTSQSYKHRIIYYSITTPADGSFTLELCTRSRNETFCYKRSKRTMMIGVVRRLFKISVSQYVVGKTELEYKWIKLTQRERDERGEGVRRREGIKTLT